MGNAGMSKKLSEFDVPVQEISKTTLFVGVPGLQVNRQQGHGICQGQHHQGS